MFKKGQAVTVNVTPIGSNGPGKSEKGFIQEHNAETGQYCINIKPLRASNWYPEEAIQAVEIPTDLSVLSLKELGQLKDDWLEEAKVGGKFETLKMIAEALGDESDSTFGRRTLKISAEHSQEIRIIADGTISVNVGEKQVAWDGEGAFYIPGYWEQYIFSLHSIALETISKANEEAAERQRLELIKELTLPELVVAQAG